MVAGYCEQKSQAPCFAAGSAQQQWLIADLQAVNRTATPWVIGASVTHPLPAWRAPMPAALSLCLPAAPSLVHSRLQ